VQTAHFSAQQKMAFAGHVVRGSSGTNVLVILERKICDKGQKAAQRECGWMA